MKCRTLGILLLMVCAVAGRAAAQETITMDLAALPINEVSTRPGGGDADYTIKLINVVPSFGVYKVDITKEEVSIAPLVMPGGNLKPPGVGAESDAACDIQGLNDKLRAATTEIAVRDIGKQAIADAPDEDCKLKLILEFKKLTTQVVDPTNPTHVTASQNLTIKAARPAGAAAGPASWTLVLQGTARGEWRTSYGFFFVPNRDDKWFTKKNGDTNTFKIVKQDDREQFDFVPTVLFTFLPSKKRGNEFVGGWTAGLGYDLEKPFVFGGYSWAYNENVIFSGGIAFNRHSRLLGKYKSRDEVVAEPLEPSQLVEDTYGPNIYVGIGFRFGEDIHARRNELEKETAKAQKEAADAKAKAAAAEKEAAARKAACEAKEEEIIKAACKAGDQPCIDGAPAKAKEKCAVTEAERAAAAKAEAQKRCEEVAKKKKADADLGCEKKPTPDDVKKCKAEVDLEFAKEMLKCIQ